MARIPTTLERVTWVLFSLSLILGDLFENFIRTGFALFGAY
jgi:hypothetical protein